MLNNIIIGRYFRTNSDVHKMNPFFKLVCLISYIVLLFIISDLVTVIIMTLFLFIIAAITKIPIGLYIKSIYGLRYLVLSLLFINVLLGVSALESIISIARVVLIVLYSTVISLTTRPLELMSALETLFKPLKILKIPVKRMSFILVNALRFIPIVIDNTNDFLVSQYIYIPSDMTIKEKIDNMKSVLVPVFANSISNLDSIIVSLELKLYDFDLKNMNKYPILKFDIYMLFAHVLLLFLLGGALWGIWFHSVMMGVSLVDIKNKLTKEQFNARWRRYCH